MLRGRTSSGKVRRNLSNPVLKFEFGTIDERGFFKMAEDVDWKAKFYDSYVSSGQARDTGEAADELFRSRAPFLNNIITKHVPPDRDARIVEIACGPGALLHFLQRAGYRNVAGVDVSPEQIAVATRLGITSARHEPLEEFLASQSAASVDVVMAIDILEHMTRPQVMDIVASIRRVLKPKGRCIAHVPNSEGIFGMRIRYGDFTHEIAFTPGSASQIFRVANFSEVRCYEDRPRVHGVISLVRRAIWEVGTLPVRLLWAAETGSTKMILSQNMIIEAVL